MSQRFQINDKRFPMSIKKRSIAPTNDKKSEKSSNANTVLYSKQIETSKSGTESSVAKEITPRISEINLEEPLFLLKPT